VNRVLVTLQPFDLSTQSLDLEYGDVSGDSVRLVIYFSAQCRVERLAECSDLGNQRRGTVTLIGTLHRITGQRAKSIVQRFQTCPDHDRSLLPSSVSEIPTPFLSSHLVQYETTLAMRLRIAELHLTNF